MILQLTWQELARMLLTMRVLTEQNRIREDVLHGVRGAKSANYRTSKNIVRAIRYKLAYKENLLRAGVSADAASPAVALVGAGVGGADRAIGPPSAEAQPGTPFYEDAVDRLMTARLRTMNKVLPAPLQHIAPQDDSEDMDNKMDELLAANDEPLLLQTMLSASEADDCKGGEVYRRCLKVLHRLCGMNQAKNLLWNIDVDVLPAYYDVIANPLSLGQVARELLTCSYGPGGILSTGVPQQVHPVVATFYRRVRLVLYNCMTFNTEATLIRAHTQKLMTALTRYTTQWCVGRTAGSSPNGEVCGPMSMDQLSDNVCILSGEIIDLSPGGRKHQQDITGVRCARCIAQFSIDALDGRLASVRYTSLLLTLLASFLPSLLPSLTLTHYQPTHSLLPRLAASWHWRTTTRRRS
jgi:hypothetical protein